MLALTVQQPWVWAILHAGKRVENRCWRPPLGTIGQTIALHAGSTVDVESLEVLFDLGLDPPDLPLLPRGAVLGTFRLAGVARGWRKVPKLQLDWWIGPWGWLLADVVALAAPVPCRGYLGLWEVPVEVRDEMQRLGAAA